MMAPPNEKAAPMPGGGGEAETVLASVVDHTTTSAGVQENTIMTAALAWALAGYRVVPCEFLGRAPSVAGGFPAASSDISTVRSWWDLQPLANVGVATGNGVVALRVLNSYSGILLKQHGISSRHLQRTTFSFRLPHKGRVYFFKSDVPVASCRRVLHGHRSFVRVFGEGDGLLVPPSRLPSSYFPGGFHEPPCVRSLAPWSLVAPYLKETEP